ncbi:putative uncharacterized protein DDB_G0279653 isoform X2 [Ochlerotatus camptorhynchus]|uniref:putative uncharacterized protein DDB_G0279653 isoform X2 n=1 Tax=Ochlerotatus camptorhynchus TaxID=644619 RepID=UPI0031D5A0FF
MANTLSAIKMTNPIRGLVSKRRIRYTQDGFDLDLTYINDRIIAMGYPAEHMESIYRNKIEDVQKMLEKNHAGCYKIYNLCSERSYNHKRFPYYSVYPFKDHNPPDIELITSFCRDVDEHLRADSKNVVAVHCKAGKGRTGTMICCYLLYSGQFNTAAEALHYYAQRRTSDSKGVTIPSQRRYVEYYATLLRSNETYQPVTLYICEIRIAPVLNFKEGTISVTGKGPMQLPEFKRAADEQQQHVVAKLDYCMPLAGDVKVELVKSSVLRKEKRCHFWFNTYFVEKSARKDAEGNLLLELSKSEIDDAHKDKHHKEYPNNFMVALVLRRVPNGRFSDSVSLKTTSSLITCAMENNRQAHLYSQNQHQQMLLQQHHSPLQQQLLQQQQQPPHRQIGSDAYRPTIIKHHNSSPGGFLQHDQQQQQQQHHHQLQQQQQQNSLPPQQNNHHNNHHPQQQQQQNLTDKQQYFKAAHENSQQQQQQQQQQHYVDDSHHHHCLEYSETSSSESSTEEEGWDSGTAVSSTIRHHRITTPTFNNNNNNTSTRNGGSGNRVAVLTASNGNGSSRTTNHASSSPPPQQQHRNRRLTYDDDQPSAGATTSHGGQCSPSGSRSSVTSAPEAPVKPPSMTSKSPIKKSASAVETAVTTAANKLRRMSTNAIFSFSAHNSSNTNCKSNNKPSTSSAVSGSSNNKCDIFNLLSRSPSTQQASSIPPSDKGSNPSSPITSPTKLVARSISNDPTASASGAPTDHLRRDSLPIIGGLLSSFSTSSVSSSNSSSLSTSTFGTGSTHQGLPLLSTTLGQPKTSKLQALFSVSSCYNGSYGRSVNGGDRKNNGRHVIRTSSYGAYGDADDDDDDGGGGGDDVDDGAEHHEDVVAAVAAVAFGSNGTRRSVGRKIGSTTSNSDSGRSSTEIGPEVDKDKELSQHNGQSAAAAAAAAAGNGCVKDLV